jgi:hypothetical protein
MNAKTLAGVAAAGAGAFAAYQGFSRGGAGGALQGVGGALGTGAAIAAMVPGGQAVALGLGIASMATSLLGGFLNGPQRRANAINTELGQDQYIPPTALNVTQSSGGTFADFDARGKLRTSNFSPYPQVTQGFNWEQTHGLFDGPPTFYNVPGGQTSQFGAAQAPAPVVHNHYWSVNTMDSASFNEFAQKNHMAFGNAVAKSIQNAHSSLTAEIQGAARG